MTSMRKRFWRVNTYGKGIKTHTWVYFKLKGFYIVKNKYKKIKKTPYWMGEHTQYMTDKELIYKIY